MKKLSKAISKCDDIEFYVEAVNAYGMEINFMVIAKNSIEATKKANERLDDGYKIVSIAAI